MGERDPEVEVAAWLASRFRHSVEAVWLERVLDGQVEVDGLRASPDRVVRSGQRVLWRRPPWEEPVVPTDVLWIEETEHYVVVDKPSGLPTLPSGGYLEHTLLHLVRARYPDAVPMHRLGTGTSGLLVFARAAATRAWMQEAWRSQSVVRIYRGVVEGTPVWVHQTVDVPIGPVPHALLGSVHGASGDGKVARSHFTLVERGEGSSTVDVAIDTGRPHQIRIHAAALGHPLSGDPLYVAGGHPMGEALLTEGGYRLHARLLEMPMPGGEHLRWESAPRWA